MDGGIFTKEAGQIYSSSLVSILEIWDEGGKILTSSAGTETADLQLGRPYIIKLHVPKEEDESLPDGAMLYTIRDAKINNGHYVLENGSSLPINEMERILIPDSPFNSYQSEFWPHKDRGNFDVAVKGIRTNANEARRTIKEDFPFSKVVPGITDAAEMGVMGLEYWASATLFGFGILSSLCSRQPAVTELTLFFNKPPRRNNGDSRPQVKLRISDTRLG